MLTRFWIAQVGLPIFSKVIHYSFPSKVFLALSLSLSLCVCVCVHVSCVNLWRTQVNLKWDHQPCFLRQVLSLALSLSAKLGWLVCGF